MTVSLIGKRIGNYDIQAKIGEGGMGMVYLGIHPQIGKRVAIKILHEDLASKKDVVDRFFTEARSVNDINHPNIVDIGDFGDILFEGITFRYIIMEFLDGEALSARIRREGVSIRETIYMISQCASALSASHGKGVVHRDLKPENIYLCSRGPDRNYIKLLDFGIAKLTGDGGAISQKTRTGMVIGTPAYMSPEQCEGKGNIDHRSDIYALGVVMYELLTGKVPFPGEGFGEVLVAHLTREPDPPSHLNNNIPPEIEAIAMRCLRKDKAQRFQSMDDLAAALVDPVTHYNHWVQTAQLPTGVMSASAGMGTLFQGGPGMQPMGMGAWNPAASGLIQLPHDMGQIPGIPGAPLRMTGMMPGQHGGNPAMMSGQNPAMMSGQNPAMSGGMPVYMTGASPAVFSGQSQVLGLPADMMLVPGVQQAPRQTTLSGASGEAGAGRRPRNVLIGFVGAIIVGVVTMVGIRTMKSPSESVQPRDGQMVTISVRSNPPQAEVMRSDQFEGTPGRTPYKFKIKKGAPPVDLKLRLLGYGEQTRTVSADKDQAVEVTLTKTAPVAEAKVPQHGNLTAPVVADKPAPDVKPVVAEDPPVPEKLPVKPVKPHHHRGKSKGKNDADGVLQLPSF